MLPARDLRPSRHRAHDAPASVSTPRSRRSPGASRRWACRRCTPRRRRRTRREASVSRRGFRPRCPGRWSSPTPRVWSSVAARGLAPRSTGRGFQPSRSPPAHAGGSSHPARRPPRGPLRPGDGAASDERRGFAGDGLAERDGQADTATISFTLSADANVTVTVVDTLGATVGVLEQRRWRRVGARTVVFGGAGLLHGVRRTDRGRRRSAVARRRSTCRSRRRDARACPARRRSRRRIARPRGHARADRAADARGVGDGTHPPRRRWVATPSAARPSRATSWSRGTVARLGKALDGTYVVSVEATDGPATATLELPFLLDGTAPAVRPSRPLRFASGLGARDGRAARERRATPYPRERPGHVVMYHGSSVCGRSS